MSEWSESFTRTMWAEVSFSAPHLLHKGLLVSPIWWRCLLRVLCPVWRPITALDCFQLKVKDSCFWRYIVFLCLCFYVCVCACVCVRKGEGGRTGLTILLGINFWFTQQVWLIMTYCDVATVYVEIGTGSRKTWPSRCLKAVNFLVDL
jgi:hypothetical protein